MCGINICKQLMPQIRGKTSVAFEILLLNSLYLHIQTVQGCPGSNK